MRTPFDELIFEGELLREIPETFVTGKWIAKLLTRLGVARQRILRTDFKSLGAILVMQDKMFAAWLPPLLSGDGEQVRGRRFPSGERLACPNKTGKRDARPTVRTKSPLRCGEGTWLPFGPALVTRRGSTTIPCSS